MLVLKTLIVTINRNVNVDTVYTVVRLKLIAFLIRLVMTVRDEHRIV